MDSSTTATGASRSVRSFDFVHCRSSYVVGVAVRWPTSAGGQFVRSVALGYAPALISLPVRIKTRNVSWPFYAWISTPAGDISAEPALLWWLS